MVLYSVSTNTSVGDLFIAGVVPGILLALLLGFVTWFIARRNNYPRFREFEQHSTGAATAHALWGLLLCVLFTVVPAAVLIGLLYAVLSYAAPDIADGIGLFGVIRSEEHTSELQSLMRISYAVFCLKKKKKTNYNHTITINHTTTIN